MEKRATGSQEKKTRARCQLGPGKDRKLTQMKHKGDLTSIKLFSMDQYLYAAAVKEDFMRMELQK